jgi:hypothetical protein
VQLNQSPPDILIVCISSHGIDGHVFAMNGKAIGIQTVVSFFEADRCPGLKGKPRVFIVQACQTAQHAARAPNVEPRMSVEALDGACEVDNVDGPSVPACCVPAENLEKLFHNKQDILIVRATVSGAPASRHTEYGSLFIRCLVYVMSRKAHKEHLSEMLTEANNIMTNVTVRNEVQVSERVDLLVKKIYLMPGWDAHD